MSILMIYCHPVRFSRSRMRRAPTFAFWRELNSEFAIYRIPKRWCSGANQGRDFTKRTDQLGEYRYSGGPKCLLVGNWAGELRSSSWDGIRLIKTFDGFLEAASDLTGLTKDNKQKIQQSQGLKIRQPIDHKRGTIEDKILQLLV